MNNSEQAKENNNFVKLADALQFLVLQPVDDTHITLVSPPNYWDLFNRRDRRSSRLVQLGPKFQKFKWTPLSQSSDSNLHKLKQEVAIARHLAHVRGKYALLFVQQKPQPFRMTFLKCLLTLKQYQLLSEGNDLNDSLINLGCLIACQSKPKFNFFNSFFLPTMLKRQLDQNFFFPDGNLRDSISQVNFQLYFNNIRRWIKTNLLQLDYLVFPIHMQMHWTLAVIKHPAALLNQQSDSAILLLDSIGFVSKLIPWAIRMFMFEYMKEKGVWSEQMESRLPCYRMLVPRQVNFHDCGIHLIQNFQLLVEQTYYFQSDLRDKTNRNLLNCYSRTAIATKRALLQRLIRQLQASRPDALQRYRQFHRQLTQSWEREPALWQLCKQKQFELFCEEYYRTDANFYQI